MKVNHSQGQMTYQIEVDKHGKTGFDFSKDFMTTGKMGMLIPTQAMRVTYGDKPFDDTSAGVQFEPLAVPMMANMFIKQEHYYTPYNCVWSNWDNFISGGEGLMYGEEFRTPPPSVSMLDIYTNIPHLNSIPLVYVDEYSTGGLVGKVVCLDRSKFIIDLITLKSNAVSQADINGTLDINYNYVVKPIDELLKLVESEKYNGVLPSLWPNQDWLPLFMQEYDPSNPAKNLVLSPDYVPGNDWKYFYDTYSAWVDRWQYQEVDSENPFYPTDFGMNVFRLMFKIIKPFIGNGSYIDFLGMNRLLPTDYYFMCMYNVLRFINSSEATGDSNESQNVQLRADDVLSVVPMNALNLRVLYLIWYNNYRDQLLETMAFKPSLANTISSIELYHLVMPRHRCWDKDSFTTALDNPATADAVVPLNATAVKTRSQEVVGVGSDEVTRNDKDVYEIVFKDNEKFRLPTNFLSTYSPKDSTLSGDKGYFSLSMLDTARRAQKFFRKALYYGNRIQDFIYTNWQVDHLDSRLRLPELLATSTSRADINALVNNTTTAESVAGDRAGYASGFDNGNKFDRFCEEAGVIISLFTVMPQPTYGYGSDRQYACLDRFDYPLPDFATDGMDAVYDTEIMSLPVKVWNLERKGLSDMPNVFGYQGRYYSEKWRPSTEHGDLLTTQDMYTFGRRFNELDAYGRPQLNYQFVHCFPRTDMFVLKDNTEDVFRVDVYHDVKVDRTLPYHSIYF